MSKAVFKSNRMAFDGKNNAFIDMVTGHMALDIERGLKVTAGMPVDKGQLKAATRAFKNSKGFYRVEVNKEYAAVQEAGIRLRGKGAPTRAFTNYTTPGTSAGFFSRAIEVVSRMKQVYINEARKALGL